MVARTFSGPAFQASPFGSLVGHPTRNPRYSECTGRRPTGNERDADQSRAAMKPTEPGTGRIGGRVLAPENEGESETDRKEDEGSGGEALKHPTAASTPASRPRRAP